MLVYANHLSIEGLGAEEAIFKAVGSWLKEQIGFGLRPTQLREDGTFTGTRGQTRSQVRIYACPDTEPALFAWVLRHQDAEVRRRRWIVEIGAKLTATTLEFSCVVRTDQKSAMSLKPITPGQPRVVRYTIQNVMATSGADFAETVPGERLKSVGEDEESYRALGYWIDKRDRQAAVVLVSPKRDEGYLVELSKLQSTLLGLAQVVHVLPNSDTRMMERILGASRSAWGGAVNVLSVPSRTGVVLNRLFLSDELCQLGGEMERTSQILMWVTESTNTRRVRDHIRPEGVRLQASRVRLRRIIESSVGDNKELKRGLRAYEELLEESMRENGNLEGQRDDIEQRLKETEKQLRKSEHSVRAWEARLKESTRAASGADVGQLIRLIEVKDEPTPKTCLEIIMTAHANVCTILPSALASASKSTSFSYGRDLLRLLRTLVTTYREQLMAAGDSKARLVFGKGEFAAKESSSVMRSPKYREYRVFAYDGRDVEMYRHLKIGVADDVAKTIRVHFHWDTARERIVIGHCGPHLPVPSH